MPNYLEFYFNLYIFSITLNFFIYFTPPKQYQNIKKFNAEVKFDYKMYSKVTMYELHFLCVLN